MSLVSIIVPVYNAEKYIEKCASSLREQTYNEIEVLLVNDGSVDNSLLLCKNIADIDSRFIVYDKENEGPGLTREFGLNKAKGDYIMFVDSDDYIEPNTIEIMINRLIRDSVDLVRCNVIIENTNSRREMWQPPFCDKIIEKDDIINTIIPLMIAPENEGDYNSRLHRGCVCSLFKRDLIEKGNIHFTRLTGGEDALFTMALFLTANKIEFIPEYFYHYEQSNDESLSKTLTESSIKQRMEKRQYINDMTKDLQCYNTIKERWEQEDRRMVYLDSRLIVHNKGMSIIGKIKMLKALLHHENSIKAFRKPINRNLPFQMYILYMLIKYKMTISLYAAIKIRRV